MRILVAYLATPGGADAVALGARLARSLEADLEITMVLPPETVIDPPGNYEELLTERAQEWLTEAKELVDDDITVSTHILFHESSAEGIIAEAERTDSAMIVVGGGGGGALVGSLTLGSVVNDLMHSSPVPVAIAPRGARSSGIRRVREVTCAIGERREAPEVLQAAVDGVARGGVGLRLVSLVAVEPISGAAKTDAEVIERARQHAAGLVEKAKALSPEDISVTGVVTSGRHIEDAVNKLDWHDGDLIVVGSSRLAQPRRIFLGSTAAKMLRVLQVPMVVVPKGDD
ncbi:universal stress protein [Gordonia sp. (in: high G+C Gram-positive bacteria)]|jgi:nucleotide-binding universal stress UspA family protein|uniref:universal stress protein n=1 Tax=Gordonia sp. (in: high G+C Gram-positive bacteria) TaxID=84139 RepID=UPI001D5E70A8|nr:universal stress protein [Gordonia sp. (in: high G+C Gram-positive bacteria)]MCB1294195.1 universal stress protein [Gordonia sp. (in: high G+C Gram-positive bacteria)]HMS77044.1 universal stress protein [Gordonia sp. (in: high G+C Gram-positive bacteria)]